MLLLKYFLNASTNNKQLNTTEKWLLLINTRNTFSNIARCPVRFQTAVGGHCRPTAGRKRRSAYRRGRSAATETATGQHPVYATGPALSLVYRFFFTILLSQYCAIFLRRWPSPVYLRCISNVLCVTRLI